jgi:mannose-1-phosphate guanylyltransferase
MPHSAQQKINGSAAQKKNSLWGIILAGGNGNRLQMFTRRFYDHDRPKQYCAFIGSRSLVQHTYDRTAKFVDEDHIATVVSGKHLPFVNEQFRDSSAASVMVQPYCRETAPSILLPLSAIHHQEPAAVTAVFPSDHFILDEWKFSRYVRSAAAFVEQHPEKIMLLGVRPNREEPGYGRIETGAPVHHAENGNIFTVRSFTEKPSRNVDTQFLWNTFVIIARADTLMEQVRRCEPELATAFKAYRQIHGKHESWHSLNKMYERLAPVNFSAAVLQRIPSHLCVMDISDVGWNDWGEERRILEDVVKYDLHLNIPSVSERTESAAA